MEHLASFVLFLLIIALLLTVIPTGASKKRARVVRILIVLLALSYYGYFFTERSLPPFKKEALSMQLINKLPQTVDFYIILVSEKSDPSERFEVIHPGKVRPEHFRLEYLQREGWEQYWIVGYLGKRNLVYFSQHAVVNKNIDQILEISTFMNQSLRLSERSTQLIEERRSEYRRQSVTITLGLLLLFLNTIHLLRRRK